MIYLDPAATSLHRPGEVGEAVLYAMEHFGNSSRGSHEAALAGARCVYEARLMLSELFHAEGPEQIAFTMNATEYCHQGNPGKRGPVSDHRPGAQQRAASAL